MGRTIFEEMIVSGVITATKGAAAEVGYQWEKTNVEMIENLRKSKLTDAEIYDLLVYMDGQYDVALSKAIEKLDV